MEIELKDVVHLYLGCECIIGDSTKVEFIRMVNETGFSVCTGTNAKDIPNWFKTSSCKPLLRPISELIDLDSDIDYTNDKGELYATLIEKIVMESESHCDAYDEWLDAFIEDIIPERIIQAPFEIVQELIKLKFDVFGLIESGQAIDKTKLIN